MRIRLGLYLCALVGNVSLSPGQEVSEKELQQQSDAYLRDELGVNDITTPSIARILTDLSVFHPVSLELIAQNPRDVVFNNRLQNALHFGALVADGFMLTIAQRSKDLQDVGRALIKQATSLSVGESLTKRGKSLLDLSDKGDWQGMREELVRTQGDVEKAMLDLRDERMAHMISLGGWLRGYQLAANSCAAKYQPDKAKILGRFDIMDYYIDRLDTLRPALKRTEFVSTFTSQLKELRELAASKKGMPPNEADVKQMRDLANNLEALSIAYVDEEGRLGKQPVDDSKTVVP